MSEEELNRLLIDVQSFADEVGRHITDASVSVSLASLKLAQMLEEIDERLDEGKGE